MRSSGIFLARFQPLPKTNIHINEKYFVLSFNERSVGENEKAVTYEFDTKLRERRVATLRDQAALFALAIGSISDYNE